jgi:hypothetical protein
LPSEVRGTPPHDLVEESLPPEDLVEKNAHEIRSAPIEVHPEGARGSEQRRHGLEPRREHIEIGAHPVVCVIAAIRLSGRPEIVVRACATHSTVGGPIQPYLLRVVGLRRKWRIDGDEVDLPLPPVVEQCGRHVEAIAVDDAIVRWRAELLLDFDRRRTGPRVSYAPCSTWPAQRGTVPPSDSPRRAEKRIDTHR